MHKGHYSESYYVLARFLGRFARSGAAISIVFRVYVELIIDPWIDYLQDHPMGRKLGALHSQSEVVIRHVLRKLQSSSDFKVKSARNKIRMLASGYTIKPLLSTSCEQIRNNP
jgi:hypothetical protein